MRNLDDTLKRRLRVRATEHDCSMEEEARQILRQVVGASTPPRDPVAALRTRIELLNGVDLDVM